MQSPGSFVKKVSYITSPGHRVRTLVSPLGVFEKREGEDEFVLTAVCPNPATEEKASAVRDVRARCGWDLKIAEDPVWVDPPTPGELRLVRVFDPHRHFLGRL
jgi:acyl CoA:acetate/3-ketoacid CoA transferase beta subunit